LNDLAKNILLWVIVAVILMMVFNNLSTTNASTPLAYSDFLQSVRAGEVKEVVIKGGNMISGKLTNGARFSTYSPETDNKAMIGELMDHGVKINAQPNEPSIWTQIFISWFPFLLIIGLWIFFMRQMQGGGGGSRGAFSFGKSRARLLARIRSR